VRPLLLDVAPLRGQVANAVTLVGSVERIEPDAVPLRAALRGDVEVDLDPDGCVPQVGELRSLQAGGRSNWSSETRTAGRRRAVSSCATSSARRVFPAPSTPSMPIRVSRSGA
jgi:hypothetical protein